ncbi:MAG: metallophosphoesterase, partial [Planctomycetaceae bacterium]
MNWWNLSLLLILVAGHTQLWVALINRLHALPLGRGVLKQLRHVHDMAVLAFPPVLFWCVGLNGPRLLTYGRWGDLNSTWTSVFVLCAIGVVGLAICVVRHQWASPVPALLAERSEIIDVARQLGGRPIAAGPYRWMARLPGNEQFTVELTEKRLALPRLPDVWNGLRILHLSDWHLMPTLDRSYFEAVTEQALSRPADLVVFSGDLVDDLDCLAWIPETIGRVDARLGRYFILGNHDWSLDSDIDRRRMSELGWQDIAGRTFTMEFAARRLVMGGD